MGMIRGIIQSVVEGTIKRFTASGREGETFTTREYMQHYGFTSRPLAGAEAVIINEGNHILMIASDDRRYRIGIEAGEVCLYTDEGDHIRFKRGKEILVKTGHKLTVEATDAVDIDTAMGTIDGTTSVVITAPTVTIRGNNIGITAIGGGAAAASLTGNFQLIGNLDVTGNISAIGTIIDGSGNTNHHTH